MTDVADRREGVVVMHELETLLSGLKMEYLGYHVESLLEQAAKKELNYREFLCMALQQEWNGRHQRGVESRLKQARFPWVKTLEQFDFGFQPGIDRKVVRELAGLAFVEPISTAGWNSFGQHLLQPTIAMPYLQYQSTA
ncbi:Insertion sequence IS5376 putative ATP-binding protein [Dickeya dianthicola]|nr:Mobile element protein [Dickeya dianthicola RNS04.9]AYC17801.1 Insertion sequence IS5376 putative ATP-binding protein [Dickeya dianthicola]